MENETIHNPQLDLAFDFVEFTGENIFLTGKAGTGKTTFLHHLKDRSPKRMIVVAPTGVAAINAGGVTIHSFFQISFGPQVLGFSAAEDQGFKRFSTEKRNIMKSLDLLVIDEISMVRADLLDGIDETLRRFRNSKRPFGGVQLLMIGDLQQLAPVVKEDEWNILRQHYKTPFFFSSNALQKTTYTSIVLHHVYRQSDRNFISLLNKIRDNKIDREVIDLLNKRYKPGFDQEDENYIILTTHNAKAKRINDSKLSELDEKIYGFEAEVGGNFPEYTFPTEVNLELKIGAQVMFVKNDPDPAKRYFNGKIGVVIEFDEGDVTVKCPEDEEVICVTEVEWQNIKYAINKETKEIKETVEGTFTQLPLKLAWAITIHKSQGLTFERAIIDSQQAFAHGQVYVALSRCRTLEGLVLSSPFSPSSLKSDKTIESFNKNAEENPPGKQELEISRMEYQKQLLVDLFDFDRLQKSIYYFQKSLSDNQESLQPGVAEIFKNIPNSFREEVSTVSEKFKTQIKQYLLANNDAEQNEELQQRIKKAVAYFSGKMQERIFNLLEGFTIETDNKEIRRTVTKAEDRLQQESDFKMACLAACLNGFVVKDYLIKKAGASFEKPTKKRTSGKRKLEVSEVIKNPELYNLLKEWRNEKSSELDLPFFMILPLKTMRAMSNQVPSNTEELKLIHGFGKKKLDKFGNELLELITNYRTDHDVVLTSVPEQEKLKKVPKKDTKLISFELWHKHKNLEKVAEEREMVVSTILGHLSGFIGEGKLPISDFVEDEKVKTITAAFKENSKLTLSEIKQKLGDDFSYTDLRCVRQHLKFLERE